VQQLYSTELVCGQSTSTFLNSAPKLRELALKMSLGPSVHFSSGQKFHSLNSTTCFPDIQHSSVVLSEWKELIHLIGGIEKDNTVLINGHLLSVAQVVAVAR
jgi:hypothetical protein